MNNNKPENNNNVRRDKHRLLYRLVFTGLFSALIFVGTFFIKIPTGVGYIHLGDGFIFIAASILPLPYAMVAAALGGGLADLIAGYAIWVPGTVVIKMLCVLLFKSKVQKLLCLRNWLALVYAAVENIGGYYLYGSIIQGNFVACLSEIPLNLIQEVGGVVIFVSMSLAFDLNPAMRNYVVRQIYDKSENWQK